jgi:hypothetical protein
LPDGPVRRKLSQGTPIIPCEKYRDYSARGGLQRLAEEGEPQGFEYLDALFACGIQIRADRAERLRSCFRPETAADFLFHLGHADRPLAWTSPKR